MEVIPVAWPEPDAAKSTPRRTLGELLRDELAFLRAGGYRRAAATPWRPPWIFLDSPTCATASDGREPACVRCPLRALAPAAGNPWRHACHAIVLNPAGQTLGELQMQGTSAQLEAQLEHWLLGALAQLQPEQARRAAA